MCLSDIGQSKRKKLKKMFLDSRLYSKKGKEEDADDEEEPDSTNDNKYYSSVNVFHLKGFGQADWGGKDGGHIVHKEDAFIGSSAYKDSDIFP